MARYILRLKIKEMGVGEVLLVPKGYEEMTLRNYASSLGKALGRKFSVAKTEAKRYEITRIS